MPSKEDKRKECVVCAKKFIPYSGRQKCCSDEECQKEFYNMNRYRKVRYILKDHPEIEPFTREDLIKVEE